MPSCACGSGVNAHLFWGWYLSQSHARSAGTLLSTGSSVSWHGGVAAGVNVQQAPDLDVVETWHKRWWEEVNLLAKGDAAHL